MIRFLKCKEHAQIFSRRRSRKLPHDIQQAALRKLRMLDQAVTIAIADAEIVSAMVLVQMAFPGAPTYHSLMPGIMHPRTGGYLCAASYVYAVGVELAHMWGVPTLAGTFGGDAPEPGWELGALDGEGLLLCALCGTETGSGMGLLKGSTVLYPEALVLDTDVYH